MPVWAVSLLVTILIAGVAGVWRIALNTGGMMADIRTLKEQMLEVRTDIKELFDRLGDYPQKPA